MKDIYKDVADRISRADAILITASNGLSISEGYHIFADNEDFRKYFGYFRQKYGVNCLIRGVFTPMQGDDHEKYMETVHRYMIDDYHGSPVMQDLLSIVNGKDYFVLTSNADTHFQMNGFDAGRIFEIEGNFDGLEEGSEGWNVQRDAFSQFVQKYTDRNLLVLELGIGARNQLIKAPVMQMAGMYRNWSFVTLNMPQEINIPDQIRERSVALPGNIAESFVKIREKLG